MKFTTSVTCQIPLLPEIFSQYFQEKTDGYFVEVGAYDGITYSNTYGLAEMGWRGLYIEAVPEYYEKCKENHKNHPNITVINEVVKDGLPTQLWKAGEYSTISDGFRKIVPPSWAADFEPQGMVDTMPLDEILWNFHDGKRLDLLVIDVEGSEVDILRHFTMTTWLPKMVIVEAHEKHHNPNLRQEAEFINNYFIRDGYQKIYSDDCNNIYIASERLSNDIP